MLPNREGFRALLPGFLAPDPFRYILCVLVLVLVRGVLRVWNISEHSRLQLSCIRRCVRVSCKETPLFYATMERVFFKSGTDVDTLVPVGTTDGKIDFRLLGKVFGLEPDSIRLGGDAISTNEELLTRASWKEIKIFLGVAGTKEYPVTVTGRPISAAPTSGEIKDRSGSWIKYMLRPQLPELPKNKVGLEKVLFPELHGKLPVTKEVYKQVAVGMPELVENFLIVADGSRLPSAVGTFLLHQPGEIVTEIQTTLIVAGSLNLFFDLFKSYVGFFKVKLSFNSTEKTWNSNSQTTEPKTRPDTIATASGCTFLVGEDRVDKLHAAEDDLRSKMKLLNPMFYGELKFILGYIAAGTEFQWMYIGNKELYRVGRPLDLLNISDRCRFLLSLGYAFQLLKKMDDSVPAVRGRRAMFSMEESPDGRRQIYFYADKVAKHIRDFPIYSADQGTDITVIKRAYAAARTCKFLPQTVAGPIETARGSYRVEFGPLGYHCTLESEEECRWMAQCVCQALCTLHSEGLVHRDVRLPNIVRLSNTDFMLIDLESVADSPFILFDGFKPFSGWYPEMYKGNQYTPLSDMYSIGKLLDEELPDTRTACAEDFVKKLTEKQLSSLQALQHAWLSELMEF